LVVTFVELIAPHTSVLTILAISFERYYAICQPLRAGYVCTKSRAMAISLFTWLCAGILTRYTHTYTTHRSFLIYNVNNNIHP
jgi:hypothetical protein